MNLRQAISQIKTKVKEVNADARLFNKGVYSMLIPTTSLFIQRESDALRLASLQELYQTLRCVKIEEAPAVDPCCGIKTLKKVYRTVIELPDMYEDEKGVIIRNVLSIDNSKSITIITPDSLRRSLEDTYSKYDKTTYGFYKDKRIYLVDPIQRINIEAMFVHDIEYESLCNCNGEKTAPCMPFLDREWKVPKKSEIQIIDTVVKGLLETYERKPNDVNINKIEGR